MSALSSVVALLHGLLVGGAFAALVALLGIPVRLKSLFRLSVPVRALSLCAVAGALLGCWFSLTGVRLPLPPWSAALFALGCGVFVGMMAYALSEVLEVFPATVGSLRLGRAVALLLLALAVGKVAGSIWYWLNPAWQ
ncbi:MAG: stage V sporulation protein AB [Christensenellales bacterium]